MKKLTILFAILIVIVMLMGSVAHAEENYMNNCDITVLDCWGKHKKCNIKFKNKSSLGSGSGAGVHLQVSEASTAKISARLPDDRRAGKNTLSIAAGSNKTMNLDKKENFSSIRIHFNRPVMIPHENFTSTVYLYCGNIIGILKGSGVCKVFLAKKGSA